MSNKLLAEIERVLAGLVGYGPGCSLCGGWGREKHRADCLAVLLPRLREAVQAERWQHENRGTIYTKIGDAELQTSEPLPEGVMLVVYRCDSDGRLWARPVSEFYGGRFAPFPFNSSPTEGASPDEAAFKVGDLVAKHGGDYTFTGEVRAAFTKRSGVRRYVVENEAGLCHIFNEGQLASSTPDTPAGG